MHKLKSLQFKPLNPFYLFYFYLFIVLNFKKVSQKFSKFSFVSSKQLLYLQRAKF